jgi:hypothetical protein
VASSRHQYGPQVALARRPILSAFLHSYGGRLYNDSTTGQVLCVELWLPNGFTPSVLIANHMLLASSNHVKWVSMLPPLCYICGVPKRAIFLIIKLLSAFFMPMQELGLLSCCEPSSQPRNDAKIPCHPHRSPSVSLLLPLLSPVSFSSSTLLSSPPPVSSCTDHSHTWGTCQGLHNHHETIHNCSCMLGFFHLYS